MSESFGTTKMDTNQWNDLELHTYTEKKRKTGKKSGRKSNLKERDLWGSPEQNARVGKKSKSLDCEKKVKNEYFLFNDAYKTETMLLR
jgi:hypothetical protein